jgi:hypothetical protein
MLTTRLGWRPVFLINVPVGVAGLLLLRPVPRSAMAAQFAGCLVISAIWPSPPEPSHRAGERTALP